MTSLDFATLTALAPFWMENDAVGRNWDKRCGWRAALMGRAALYTTGWVVVGDAGGCVREQARLRARAAPSLAGPSAVRHAQEPASAHPVVPAGHRAVCLPHPAAQGAEVEGARASCCFARFFAEDLCLVSTKALHTHHIAS